MTRRKKVLCWLLGLLVTVTVAAYFVANSLLDQATRQAMAHVVQVADKQGLEVLEPSFESSHLSPLLSASWSGLTARIRLPEGADSASDRLWDVEVHKLQVNKSFSDDSVVKIDHVRITSDANDSQAQLKSSQRVIELKNISCRCPLSLFDPGKSLRTILPEVVSLLSATEFKLPLELSGSLSFSLRGDPVRIGIEVLKQDGAYALRLVPDDVAKLSSRFDEQLTDAEVELIADFPLRSARLLEIKDAAESDSRQAHQRDESVPEDAYRHVLWSYLLAKTYDEAFAKSVGDAHEAGDTGNTPAERAMDYHNNAIGRSYAEKEIPRSSVLKRVLADSSVRREP